MRVTKLLADIGTVGDLVPLPRPPVLGIGRSAPFVNLPLRTAKG